MKKLLFLISLMLMSTLISSAQMDISVGISRFNLDTKLSSNIGLNLGFTYNRFYFDYSNNLAIGPNRFEIHSSNGHNTNKLNVSAFNIGYNINVLPSSRVWYVTPLIGYVFTHEIYEIQPNRIIYSDNRNHNSFINFGFITKVYIGQIGIYAGMTSGTSVLVNYKFGLAYKFN